MKTYIDEITKNGKIRVEILGRDVTFSTGDSLEVKTTYTHDGTDRSQALTRRVRNTALGASLRWQTGHYYTTNLFDYIAEIEDLCGKQIVLTFNGREYPKFIVQNVGVTANCDAVDIFSDVSLSLDLVEGHIHKETPFVAVGTLKKGSDYERK